MGLLDGSTLDCDPGLLALQLVQRDGVCETCCEEAIALRVETLQQAFRGFPVRAVSRQDQLHVLHDGIANIASVFGAKSDGRPMSRDELLDEGHWRRSKLAAVLVVLSAEAIEVVVQFAASVAAAAEGESTPALTAEDRTFEVVGVGTRLLTALESCLADALDLSEQML